MKKFILMLTLAAFAGGLSAQSTSETTKAPVKEDAVKVQSSADRTDGKSKAACCASKAKADGKVAAEGGKAGCCAGKSKAEAGKSCAGEAGKSASKGACCAGKDKAEAKAAHTDKVATEAPAKE